MSTYCKSFPPDAVAADAIGVFQDEVIFRRRKLSFPNTGNIFARNESGIGAFPAIYNPGAVRIRYPGKYIRAQIINLFFFRIMWSKPFVNWIRERGTDRTGWAQRMDPRLFITRLFS
jgi:hypothetical protein